MASRIPSAPDRILDQWTGLPGAADRRDFLDAAINRKRLDAIRVAASCPALAAPLPPKSYKLLAEQVARADAVDLVEALNAFGPHHQVELSRLGQAQPWRHLAVEAVRSRAIGVLKDTLARGLDPLPSDRRYGTTLCHMIAAHGWIEGLEAISDRVGMASLVALRDDKARTILHTAASYAQPVMVQYLLEQGADINARDSLHRTAFFKCVAGETEGMGPARGDRWMETAFCLMDRGCVVDEHIGKTDRSQTLRAYLADRCPDVLSVLETVWQERRLQETTQPAAGSSSVPRL